MGFAGLYKPPFTKSSSSSAEGSTTTGYAKTVEDIAAPTAVNSVVARYSLAAAVASAATESVAVKPFVMRLTKNAVNIPIIPGSVLFSWGGNTFYDVLGSIYSDRNPATGVGILRGSIDYLTGIVTLDVYDGGDNTLVVHSLAGRLGSQYVTEVTFRTAGTPLRSESLTIAGVTMHGERFSAIADGSGIISGDHISGAVDLETGIVTIGFGQLVDNLVAYETELWYNPDLVTDDGTQVWKPEPVYADSLTYACVVYSYIPLDADLLGINPVRLPVDGRVPIVKPGNVVVIHNTRSMTMAASPVAGQSYTLPRNADTIEIYDSSDPPLRVPSSMYAFEDGTDTITIDSLNNDFTGYTLPLVAMHRIEDMVLVSRTQINGQISLSRPVNHDYEAADTLVSSALLFGDLQAKAYNLFDQKTWASEFSDDRVGDAATGTYNEIDYPIEVYNSGAVSERWALVFDSDTHFNIIGEKRGVIGDGYTSQDCQPVNESTGYVYFFMDHNGFGSGWATGNVIRFNTDSAAPPAWAVRTTLQGEETEAEDFFVIQPRGDAS